MAWSEQCCHAARSIPIIKSGSRRCLASLRTLSVLSISSIQFFNDFLNLKSQNNTEKRLYDADEVEFFKECALNASRFIKYKSKN